ncbi:MAG: sulfur carrier protein ThiS [Endomicrobium sp.]|jgi:sulfur carrier protein|nr:sulfur carrier protein ThiS [Endomicrobium sp.]
MVTIKLNGKDGIIGENLSLLEILKERNIIPETVVVALNMKVINQNELEKTFLSDGDSVEILRFVAGG